ncbi:MAG: glycoside hydrolase [Bacilli bacterium]|nr:glycoside hydrolase [Bacilli bacterium]
MTLRKKLVKFMLCGLITVSLTNVHDKQVKAESSRYNMSYVFYGKTDELVQEVDQTKHALQTISPSYWQLAVDGSLQISDTLDPVFIEQMHKRNIKVVPFLSNDFNRSLAEQALQNRTSLTAQIAAAITKYHLDGINIDLENLQGTSRNSLTDFVKQLRAKLPVNIEVSIAVPANPDLQPLNEVKAYDYKALAAASDYVMLMAYDEHYPGDPIPGPVASLSFVEKSVQYALSQMSSDKLVLGIPFYGRLWNGDSSYDGAGIPNDVAAGLATKYHGQEIYDSTEQSVRSQFTIHAGDPSTIVNGQPLPNGSYTVWYDNEQSIKAKLALVQKYNLKGTGSWSLNQAAAETWSYYDLWLNAHYFSDIAGLWAQPEVIEAANKGWMLGISSSQFAPNQSLTRAQAATVLARAMNLKNTNPQVKKNLYTDVPSNYWAYDSIAAMQQKGFISGIGNGLFAPDEPMTREQMCTLLVQALGLKASAASVPFSDVDPSSWSLASIAVMSSIHIIFGYDDGSFHPQEPISRAQMAALMIRLQDRISSK